MVGKPKKALNTRDGSEADRTIAPSQLSSILSDLSRKSLNELTEWTATHGRYSDANMALGQLEMLRRQTAAQLSQARWVKITALAGVATFTIAELVSIAQWHL